MIYFLTEWKYINSHALMQYIPYLIVCIVQSLYVYCINFSSGLGLICIFKSYKNCTSQVQCGHSLGFGASAPCSL